MKTDIIRIEPVKAYPNQGAQKFIWGGKSAVMGEETIIQMIATSMLGILGILVGKYPAISKSGY